MTEPCEYCASERVVPVLDKRIEKAPRAGNKYRTRCLGCWRWLPMTSKAAFKQHENSHILPADADPEKEDNLVALDDYDYRDEIEELVEKQERQRAADVAADGGKVLATDGGQDVPESETPTVEDDDDEEQGERNRFECPATGCGATVDGRPEECPECEAPYNWDN